MSLRIASPAMGGHHARHAAPETGRMRRLALLVIVPIAVLTVAAMALLWPREDVAADQGPGVDQVAGEVVAVDRVPCPEGGAEDVNGCGTAEVELARDGATVEAPLPSGPSAPQVAEGDDVLLIESSGPEGEGWWIVDHQRGTELWVLAAAFALALVAFGRWRSR